MERPRPPSAQIYNLESSLYVLASWVRTLTVAASAPLRPALSQATDDRSLIWLGLSQSVRDPSSLTSFTAASES